MSCDGKTFKVVVCVDHSTNAEKAFEFYSSFLNNKEHEVIILHVSECINLPVLDYVTVELDKEANRIKARNETIKNKFGEICHKHGIKYRVVIVPGEEGIMNGLLNNIKKYEANMIVMGTRGLGTIRRTFLGSVSDYIIHHTHIPVFICPP